MAYSVVSLPGDGIGVEVLREGLRVLHAVADALGLSFQVEEIQCGGRFYLEHGSRDWEEGAEEKVKAADVVFLGAVGWNDPKTGRPVTMANGHMAGWSPVIGTRAALDLYANIRPVKLYPGVPNQIHGRPARVWDADKVDMVIFRENTEDLYSGINGRLRRAGRTEVVIDNRVITRHGCERIIRRAFEYCRQRDKGAPADGRKRVTCIAKDNVLEGCRFFVEVFNEIGAEYPDIEKDYAIVDAFTQWLIQKPEWYDVCVTTNMFGDIVTDLASVLQGGMGTAVGANVGDEHAMFEPIHGSAPKHAGKDKANPIAMILAVKEGLDWLGARKGEARLPQAAAAIEAAVMGLLEAGAPLTYDMAGEARAARCSEVGKAIADRAVAALA